MTTEEDFMQWRGSNLRDEEQRQCRLEKLHEVLEESFSGYDFTQWWAEAKKGDLVPDTGRYAYVHYDGVTAWIDFCETLAEANYIPDGFEPCAVIDLATGEQYLPILQWEKVP